MFFTVYIPYFAHKNLHGLLCIELGNNVLNTSILDRFQFKFCIVRDILKTFELRLYKILR